MECTVPMKISHCRLHKLGVWKQSVALNSPIGLYIKDRQIKQRPIGHIRMSESGSLWGMSVSGHTRVKENGASESCGGSRLYPVFGVRGGPTDAPDGGFSYTIRQVTCGGRRESWFWFYPHVEPNSFP